MSVKSAIEREIDRIADAQACIAVLARIKDVAGIEQVSAWRGWFGAKEIRVSASVSNGAHREAVRGLLKALGVKRAVKRFDEATGQVIYVVTTDDASVTLTAGAPTNCEIERVEEEVEVPEEIKPAHTETKVRYRLKDARCLEGRAPAAIGERETMTETDGKAVATADDEARILDGGQHA